MSNRGNAQAFIKKMTDKISTKTITIMAASNNVAHNLRNHFISFPKLNSLHDIHAHGGHAELTDNVLIWI
jgi:hypothetical protein